MIMYPHCMVCPDIKKVKSDLHNMENILRRLDQIRIQIVPRNYKPSREYKIVISRHFTNKNPRTRCGNCPKINMSEFRRIEGRIIENCEAIFSHFDIERESENKAKYKRQVLDILRGNYPTLFRLFEKI